jgi:hypothetical protein
MRMIPKLKEFDLESKLIIDDFIKNYLERNPSDPYSKLLCMEFLHKVEGSCYSYMYERLRENPVLMDNYSQVIYEVAYNKMESKSFIKNEESITSRDWESVEKDTRRTITIRRDLPE